MAYIIYAFHLGLVSAYIFASSPSPPTCPSTAHGLFISARVFVCLTLAGSVTLVFGCFLPFLAVTYLLTRNGYSPTLEDRNGGIFEAYGVFPSIMAGRGAPEGCVDRMKRVELEDFGEGYPTECCICMAEFTNEDVIVATECEHVFHRQCCDEWLQQARTCPNCRADIVTALDLTHGTLERPPETADSAEGEGAGGGGGAGGSSSSSRWSPGFMQFPFNFTEMRGMIESRSEERTGR